MIAALEREVAREERMREFVSEALVSDDAIEEGATVYRAEETTPGWNGWPRTAELPGPSRGENCLFGGCARKS